MRLVVISMAIAAVVALVGGGEGLNVALGHPLAGQAHGHTLQFAQKLPQGEQLHQAHLCNVITVPGQGRDPALSDQLQEGLTDRRSRHVEEVRQSGFVDGIARPPPAARDLFLDVGPDPIARFHAPCL